MREEVKCFLPHLLLNFQAGALLACLDELWGGGINAQTKRLVPR